MEQSVINYLLQQGGGYALAAVLFYFYRKDVLGRLEETKEEKAILVELISDTKVAIVELSNLVRNLVK